MKDRIKKVMETQHMTQQVFAEFIGIAPASLSSIFTGRTRPTLQVVYAIKNKINNISTDWLMFGTGEMYVSDAPSDSTPPQDTASGKAAEQPLAFDEISPTAPYAPPSHPTARYIRDDMHQEVKIIDKPQRRITEIRIFYDDQTWETFVPKK